MLRRLITGAGSDSKADFLRSLRHQVKPEKSSTSPKSGRSAWFESFTASCLALALFSVSAWASAGSVNLVVNHNAVPASATGPAGGDFSYSPLVSLNGGAIATQVKLTEVLPLGVKLNSIAFEPPNSGTCAAPPMPFVVNGSNKSIVCDLIDIAQSGSQHGIRVHFNVTIPEVGTKWEASASATALDADVSPGSNADLKRNITTTDAADLGIQLSGPGNDAIKQFTPFNYTVKVTNHGPSNIPSDGKVVVRFLVPPNSVAGNAQGAGWACVPNGGAAGTEMVCERAGLLAKGQSVPNDLILPVTPLATGELDATVTVSGRGQGNVNFPDGVLTNNTASVRVNVKPDNVVNLSLAKTASPRTIDKANIANQVAYTLTPKRVSGSDVPSNVRLVDPLVSQVTSYTIATKTDWNCSASTSILVDCAFIGTTPTVGKTYPPLLIKAVVNGASGGVVSNTATVSASNEDPNAHFDNTATDTITISNAVNLSLQKAASKSPIKAGEAFNWTLTVRNPAGSLPVNPGQEITLIDNVPAGVEITGFSNAAGSSGWACTPVTANGPATITCRNSAGLAANASSGLILHSKGVFTNTGTNSFVRIANNASVTGVGGRDPFPAISSSASVNVSENQVDIGIEKSASPARVDSGEVVTYRLIVRNNDASKASTGIVVTDVLNNLVTSKQGCALGINGSCEGNGLWPTGGYVSATFISGTGECSANGNKDSESRTVTCNIPQLAAGQSATIDIKARHYAKNANGSNAALVNNNTASVRSTEVENTNATNDKSTVPVEVVPVTDIQVFKSPSPTPAAIGEAVTYTIHVYNAGPSHAAAVSLKDVLPAGAHWVEGGFNPGQAQCNAPAIADDAVDAVLTCRWAEPLAPNGQYAISYQMRSSPDAKEGEKMVNTVDVDTTTQELTKQNNRAKAEVVLKPAELDVVINMEHTEDALVLGESTIYSIMVTNTGPSYATQVKMTDVFPGTLDIGGQKFSSSAVFSYQGVTELSSVTEGGAAKDLMGSLSTLCQQPADGIESSVPLQLVCTFDKLAPGETITIKFKMTAAQLPEGKNTGTIFHNAKVELKETEHLHDGSDTDFNNFTSDRTSARRSKDSPLPEMADLALVKEADSETGKGSPALHEGQALTYTLTATNLGPESSSGSQIRDTLPIGLDFVSAPGCQFDAKTRLITCDVEALAKDEARAFTIATTVSKPYVGDSVIKNRAQVFAEGDPNPSNDESETTTTVFKPVEAVPTLGQWGLFLLLLVLAGLGAKRLHQRG